MFCSANTAARMGNFILLWTLVHAIVDTGGFAGLRYMSLAAQATRPTSTDAPCGAKSKTTGSQFMQNNQVQADKLLGNKAARPQTNGPRATET